MLPTTVAPVKCIASNYGCARIFFCCFNTSLSLNNNIFIRLCCWALLVLCTCKPGKSDMFSAKLKTKAQCRKEANFWPVSFEIQVPKATFKTNQHRRQECGYASRVLRSEPWRSGLTDALNDHQQSWSLLKYVCVKMTHGCLIYVSKFKCLKEIKFSTQAYKKKKNLQWYLSQYSWYHYQQWIIIAIQNVTEHNSASFCHDFCESQHAVTVHFILTL